MMQVVHSFQDIPANEKFVFGIGFFDGFHKGHQEIWRAVKELAAETHARPGMITFYPHPAAVLFPERQMELLQTEEEKESSFARAGAAVAVILRPTRAFLDEPSDSFLRDLASIPGLRGLVCGENFSFGKGAEGNPQRLADHFVGTDVAVRVMPLLTSPVIDGRVISSTEIRKLLRAGDVKQAAVLLGQPYSLSGDVVHGFRRGTEALGFPTANLAFGPDRVMPADGVYATYARIRGNHYPAVTNIGKNPTFGNTERTVETFILDFDSSIYGEPFTIELIARLRGEIHFKSIEALKAQIGKDIEKANEELGIRN